MVLHVSTDLIAQLTPIKFLVDLTLSVLHNKLALSSIHREPQR